MASTEAATSTLSVDQIAAMSDTELDHFITKHRNPHGDYDLPVDGWDKLTKDERDRLAERLKRAQERGLARSPTACSRPLDLDDLDARLRQVSPNNRSFSRPEPSVSSRSRSPTLSPPDPTLWETETYYMLIEKGGRPLYSIDLIEDVHRDPDNYAEMLRPWLVFDTTPVYPSGIFEKQLQRWEGFRDWQNDNRGREDDDDGFLDFVEYEKRAVPARYPPRVRDQKLAEIEADPSCLRSTFAYTQGFRERQRRYCRERGCRGFRDYAEAVKRRLARHGLTQPFNLDEDPTKQDKLTTWIEYLTYEYWWLDKHTSDIERLEPKHDKLWQGLVDDKILRPHETKEFVRTIASPMERASEEERARKEFERAKLEAKRIYELTQEDPNRLSIPKEKRVSMVQRRTDTVHAARRRFEQVQSRNNRITQFIRATFDYGGAKKDATRQRVLVQWVLDQVPQVEAEMNPSKAKNTRLRSSGRRSMERRRTSDAESEESPPRKRVRFKLGSGIEERFELEETRFASARVLSKATTQLEPGILMDQETTQGAQPGNRARSRSQQEDVQTMPQELRRSARIAARRNASNIGPEPVASQPRTRSRSGATPAQPSRSRSPIGSAKARTAERPPRGKTQRGASEPNRSSQRRRQRRG